MCANTPTLDIYQKAGSGWSLQHSLSEHDKIITGLDWAPNSQKIVSVSQDRNAYVWELNSAGTWTPTLVLLRLT